MASLPDRYWLLPSIHDQTRARLGKTYRLQAKELVYIRSSVASISISLMMYKFSKIVSQNKCWYVQNGEPPIQVARSQ